MEYSDREFSDPSLPGRKNTLRFVFHFFKVRVLTWLLKKRILFRERGVGGNARKRVTDDLILLWEMEDIYPMIKGKVTVFKEGDQFRVLISVDQEGYIVASETVCKTSEDVAKATEEFEEIVAQMNESTFQPLQVKLLQPTTTTPIKTQVVKGV